MPRDAVTRPGFCFHGGRVAALVPSHWSGLLSTAEAARLVGVKPGTIRKWRSVGYLEPQGLDERGWPMHSAEAVRMAEEHARESGLQSATGADPRRLRGRTAPGRRRRGGGGLDAPPSAPPAQPV